jgi:hypothetical protein
MKLSETIKKVIPLAQAISDYWETELPKRYPNYPLVNPGEEDPPPPPEEKKLKQLLARLPENDICKIALVAHIGQRGYGTDDLPARFQRLKEWEFEDREWAATRMSTDTSLALDLLEGLDLLKKKGLDVDHLMVTPASTSP